MAALTTDTQDTAADKPSVIRVMLWCVPRAVSTSFLKCMTYVPDSQVWMEPFLYADWYSIYGRYRESTIKYFRDAWEAGDGGAGASLNDISGGYLAGDKSYSWVTKQLEASPPGIKVIFCKDMSFGLDAEHFKDIPKGFRHSFLIRHPYKVFDSWERNINRSSTDTGKKRKLSDLPECMNSKGHFFKEQYDLYKYVKEHYEPNPVIIDIDDLLADPGRVLKAYCGALGIPYSDDLLQWTPGQECMDHLWMVPKEHNLIQNTGNPHRETFASTCFGKPTEFPQRSGLSDDVLYHSDLCMKYYEEMYKNRLKP